MKICGTVSVEVPECEEFDYFDFSVMFPMVCNEKCELRITACKRQITLHNWPRLGRWVIIPGPTCPAHDTVPNPWADYVCLTHPDGKPTGVTAPGDRPEAEWHNHKAALAPTWEEKPCGPCPECGRDAWVNKWNIWYCDACGKACP